MPRSGETAWPHSAPLLGLALLAACVPVPEGRLPALENPRTMIAPAGVFPGLDPGAKEAAGLHFLVKSYGSDRTLAVSSLAESLYARVMTDTGLYSFRPAGLYNIVVYSGREEYLKKTGQPDWSGGLTAGNSIYVYDGPQLGPALAHEMTHLIFHEYMGSSRPDVRWLNEGLAVYEETQEMVSEGLRPDWRAQWQNALRSRAFPFDQMTNLVPATERDRQTDLWYQQVGDVVRFMVERGGRNGVSQFLASVRDGRSADDAARLGFAGIWGRLSDMERAWRQSL